MAAQPLRAILEGREAGGDYSWTLCMLPTAELARQAGISLQQYTPAGREGLFPGLGIGRCPSGGEIHHRAAEIKRGLDALPVVGIPPRIRNDRSAPDPLGAKRRWAGVSGRNIPSFELFVSPDWRGTPGRVQRRPALVSQREHRAGGAPGVQGRAGW